MADFYSSNLQTGSYRVTKNAFLPSPAVVRVTQGQATEPCQSFQHYVSEHPNCTSFGDCYQLFCWDPHNNYAYFIVNQCEDPVTVDVGVSSPPFQHQYNRSETEVGIDGTPFTAIMARNASHLELEVSMLM